MEKMEGETSAGLAFAEDRGYGIIRMMSQLYRAQYAHGNQLLAPLGLTSLLSTHLMMIRRSPGLNQNELAQRLDVSKVMVSKTLKQLEEMGAIRREPAPGDGRFLQVFLTEQGEALAQGSIRLQNQALNSVLAGFTQQEKQQLSAYLQRMTENMAREWGPCCR